MNLFTNRLLDLENEFIVTREEGWGEGIVREFGIDMYTLLYLKWITNKDLLFSSRELCSMSCGNLDRKGTWERMDTHAPQQKISQDTTEIPWATT